ncbi:YhgE/Pip-like protein [Fictibacillus macauensis ZFHKF-1]|uniref:YhgE/Pip-like protein n=1 Tax=Fictibacillus macauensis ZFHKF-1 TaxID=1196324 RepID=I8J1Q9_9BACL|nr:YhgE/Pip domain-containing protein [Fictibacillus macauensis]EIT85671.1 YhgE/Pip-like protein [Fictibacillus macauensis ZFHKF-1]
MKKTLKIYRDDWREIASLPIMILLLIGLTLLPSVYAWVNIRAMWDPYENTSGIKVAIVNEDVGATIKNKHLNIGKQTVNKLKKNHKLGWTFVNREQAKKGIRNGTYYATLLIPRNFSKKISSIASNHPEKPTVTFTVNEKINAVTPKITKSGVSTVVNQVSNSFTKGVGQVIFSKFNEAGLMLQRKLPLIRQFEDKLFKLEQSLPEIKKIGTKITIIDQNFNDIQKKVQNVSKLKALTPKLDEAIPYLVKVNEQLPVLKEGIDSASDLNKRFTTVKNETDSQLNDILKKMIANIEEAKQQAKDKDRDQLQEIQTSLEELQTSLQNQSQSITDHLQPLNDLVTFNENQWPHLEDSVQKAALFAQNDWPSAQEKLSKAERFVHDELPKAGLLLHKAALAVKNDLPGLEAAVTSTAKKIRDFEKNSSVSQVITALRNDAKLESDFLASPLILKEKKLFPVPNYGSAMTPFYTLLALWVGGMLLISSLKVGRGEIEDSPGGLPFYYGRLLTFLTIGFFQGLVVSLGDLWIIHAYIRQPLAFVLFSIMLSIVFMIIIYTFSSFLGNIGKGLAVILLVLQFSSSGGTFPVAVTSSFFKHLNPFMPFTYGVSLLREASGGIITEVVVSDIVHLLLFPLIFLLLPLLFKNIFQKKPRNKKRARIFL